MDLNKKLVVIKLKGVDPETYADYDSAYGYGGADQILLEKEGVIITTKELEKSVRETLKRCED